MITLEKSGLFTSVQRIVPPTQVAYGVPFGGPMDRKSARMANELVSNPADEYVLEMTLLGATIRFHQSCMIALTGADMDAKVDGMSIPRYQTLPVKPNQLLVLKGARDECRAYLAVGGQWEVASSQTSLGTQRLFAGFKLRITPNQDVLGKRFPIPPLTQDISLPILPGPEFDQIDRAYIAHFFSQTWRVSQDSNRVGCRLEGAKAPSVGINEIISSGIVPGTIQVTGSGQPILLTADAQTTGGYPRMGNVPSANLDVVGQLRPGATIRFAFKQPDLA